MRDTKGEEIALIERIVTALESFADSFRRYVELQEQTAEEARKAMQAHAETGNRHEERHLS